MIEIEETVGKSWEYIDDSPLKIESQPNGVVTTNTKETEAPNQISCRVPPK